MDPDQRPQPSPLSEDHPTATIEPADLARSYCALLYARGLVWPPTPHPGNVDSHEPGEGRWGGETPRAGLPPSLSQYGLPPPTSFPSLVAGHKAGEEHGGETGADGHHPCVPLLPVDAQREQPEPARGSGDAGRDRSSKVVGGSSEQAVLGSERFVAAAASMDTPLTAGRVPGAGDASPPTVTAANTPRTPGSPARGSGGCDTEGGG